MIPHDACSRQVKLELIGFDSDPDAAGVALSASNFTVHRQGTATPNGRRTYKENQLSAYWGFNGEVPWSDCFSALLNDLGGVDRLERFLADLEPRDRLLEFAVPVQGSPHQENNFLSVDILEVAVRLRLDIGFYFPEFDASDPTHLSPQGDIGFDV